MTSTGNPEVNDFEQPSAIAREWLAEFAAAMYAADANAVANTIQPSGWFRDSLTFSWDNRTQEGRQKIVAFLAERLPTNPISKVEISESQYLQPDWFPFGPMQGVEFGFTYETPIALGNGLARLLKDEDGWKAHLVSMIIGDLKGYEEPTGRYCFETLTQGKTWGEYTTEQKASWEKDPYVVVVGGGQIGLQIAARFKQMGIPHILIERNGRIGDNWRKRYASLALHTLKEQHQLLYQPHPSNWPIYAPRDRVADMLETYAITQELLVWTNSYPVGSPIYDHRSRRWTIIINRDGKDVILHPGHIVLATGTLGAPKMPELGGREQFSGTVIHSAQFDEPSPFKDKNVVVVGSGNSSVDICQDLAEGGAATVTMIQRSPTCVVDREKMNVLFGTFFRRDVPIDVYDFKLIATPKGYISKMAMTKPALDELWESHKDTIQKVRKGGFVPDLQKPMVTLWLERLGGYWMDKGAAALMASGDINVISGVEPRSFTKEGIVLSDGSEVAADAVIFATGYVNIREVNRQLFGTEVIDKTREVWGLDEEGEMRGSYRPSGYPGLWFAAGDFANARFESKTLAILIKAVELGLLKQT